MASIETTRCAMYELVWSKPMTKVAADFGISDVALKKICQRHRVPTPPRGFWAKKEAGKPVKQTRFVETADPQDELIEIHGGLGSRLPEPVKAIINRERAAQKQRAATIELKSNSALVDIHRVVAATAKVLRTSAADEHGAVAAIGDGMCGVTTGKASAERVIATLDGLARSLEARGIEIVPAGSAMTISSDGENVMFSLKEKVRYEEHVPTRSELVAENRRRSRLSTSWEFSFERSYRELDTIRTGQLSLEIADCYLTGFRRVWRDGKRQRLESLVEDMAIGLIAYAAGLKLKHEESERWRRNWERKCRVQRRAEERQCREEQRRAILDGLVAISVERDRLRTWLKEVEHWPAPSQRDELTRFVDWAQSRYDHLEHQIEPTGIAKALRERKLFPEIDPLLDPPEDLINE